MSEEQRTGITKIAVKGFKSIAEECEIDIRPLTILAGANSSGKSSIMQPLLLLKQTLEATYDPGPLLLNGPNVRFTEVSQFLSTLSGEKGTDRFQIGIDTSISNFSHSIKITFKKGPGGIEIVEMTSKGKSGDDSPVFPEDLTLYPEMPPEKIKALTDQYMILRVASVDRVKRSRCFLRLASQGSSKLNLDTTVKLINDPQSDILETIHLPGLRGNPERIYKLTTPVPGIPARLKITLRVSFTSGRRRKTNALKTVANTLHTLGLTDRTSSALKKLVMLVLNFKSVVSAMIETTKRIWSTSPM